MDKRDEPGDMQKFHEAFAQADVRRKAITALLMLGVDCEEVSELLKDYYDLKDDIADDDLAAALIDISPPTFTDKICMQRKCWAYAHSIVERKYGELSTAELLVFTLMLHEIIDIDQFMEQTHRRLEGMLYAQDMNCFFPENDVRQILISTVEKLYGEPTDELPQNDEQLAVLMMEAAADIAEEVIKSYKEAQISAVANDEETVPVARNPTLCEEPELDEPPSERVWGGEKGEA